MSKTLIKLNREILYLCDGSSAEDVLTVVVNLARFALEQEQEIGARDEFLMNGIRIFFSYRGAESANSAQLQTILSREFSASNATLSHNSFILRHIRTLVQTTASALTSDEGSISEELNQFGKRVARACIGYEINDVLKVAINIARLVLQNVPEKSEHDELVLAALRMFLALPDIRSPESAELKSIVNRSLSITDKRARNVYILKHVVAVLEAGRSYG
jgi:hypothetical protein